MKIEETSGIQAHRQTAPQQNWQLGRSVRVPVEESLAAMANFKFPQSEAAEFCPDFPHSVAQIQPWLTRTNFVRSGFQLLLHQDLLTVYDRFVLWLEL